MNGGNTDPDCAIRVSRTVEFLFYSVVSRSREKLSVGNFAMACNSHLAKRLRAIGVNVDHIT